MIHAINPIYVICVGDYNTDIMRNMSHSLTLLSFVGDFNMIIAIEVDIVDVPYTCICNATAATSKIDHIGVLDNMFCKANSCDMLDNALHSDHVPVRIGFDSDIDHVALSERNHSVRAAWYKTNTRNVSINKYKADLENKNLIVYNIMRIFFHIIMCFALIHKNDICALYNNVIQCVIGNEKSIINTTLHTNKSTVPGWTENVKQYKQVALYWHICWKDEGCPHQGETS